MVSGKDAMSSAASARPLVALWSQQHRVILHLLAQLAQGIDWDPNQRRMAVQRVRQRLSRHIQLERHALYPLLRAALEGDPGLLTLPVQGRESSTSAPQQLEQQLRDLLPELTQFLHQAERSPQQLDLDAARRFHHQLRTQFEQEERLLYPLVVRWVSPEAEQQQLRLFYQRLKATLAAPASSSRNSRASLEDWERQAVTRPVLPKEKLRKTLHPTPGVPLVKP